MNIDESYNPKEELELKIFIENKIGRLINQAIEKGHNLDEELVTELIEEEVESHKRLREGTMEVIKKAIMIGINKKMELEELKPTLVVEEEMECAT